VIEAGIECSKLHNVAIRCAIGRIFRILSRPFKDGDIEEYERCRSIIFDLLDTKDGYEVNYVRDRLKGSQGD
jgi:hypothetical protein